jgi:LacI family transcriptional regulator
LLGAAIPEALPTVLMNTPTEDGGAAAFLTDNFGGAHTMVSHLQSLGYQRIAHIAGPDSNYESGERLRGFRAALELQAGSQALVIAGDFSEESGYRAGKQIAAATPRPEAVFAANDMMAIGCMFALSEAGLRIPHDIAVTGFDDIPIARFVTPPLTTVRAQTTELGRQALDELAGAIDGGHSASSGRRTAHAPRHVLSTQLIVRGSCTRRQESGVNTRGQSRRIGAGKVAT